MLEDRSYLRAPDTGVRRPVVIVLIWVLVAAFLLQCFAEYYFRFDTIGVLGLGVSGLKQGRYWQLLTFQFLHSFPWPWHLLGNCIGLYFFGREVEMALGSRKFLTLYAISGLVGGLLQILTTLILPHHSDAPVVGASAGVCGIIATFAMLFPMREGTFIIYFFPVTLRAIYFLWFLSAISLFGTIFPFDRVAHAAHLGGLLVGIGYVRWLHESDGAISFLRSLRPRRRSRPLVKVRFPKTAAWESPKALSDPDTAGDEFMSREIDPILDKISAHGMQSLTVDERKILENARARMRKP